MKVEKLEFDKLNSFSKLFLDYLKGDARLAPTHAFEPSIDGFELALSYRKLNEQNRANLADVLTEDYAGLSTTKKVQKNIAALRHQQTYTVTTGHQLNIFTGPLFFIFKIVTTIKICQRLSKKFPEFNFVPVYWMASEDHDFEEINHAWVDGKKYTWETEQQGAVGRFDPAGLAELAESIPGKTAVFKKAYGESKTLAEAVRRYVNELFGEWGLIVLDADRPQFKKEFASIMADELKNQSSSQAVASRSTYLQEQGYKAQINARDINLFYLDNHLRARIEKEGDQFRVVDTDMLFSQSQLLNLLETSPEKFSPNVILRPLYQEVILPNLGYVGGPAELAYWLQLKEVFDYHKIDYPVLMPRTFGLYLDTNIQRKKSILGLANDDLFLQVDALKKKYVHEMNKDILLETQRQEIKNTYDQINDIVFAVDSTLGPHIEAQLTKHQKCLDDIQNKLVKAEKRNREDEMKRIEAVNQYVFPGGSLMERRVNFLSVPNDSFINDVQKLTDPFDLRLHIFLE